MRKELIIILLIIVLVFGRGFLFSFFEPSSITLIQYAGTFEANHDQWYYHSPRPINHEMTAKLGDYEIQTELSSYECAYSDYYCHINDCNGQEIGLDADGCMIYRGQVLQPEFVACANCLDQNSNQVCYNGGVCEGVDMGNKQYTTTECGGLTRDTLECTSGCWGKYTIRKNNMLEQEYAFTKDSKLYQIDEFTTVNLGYRDAWYYGDCYRVENLFAININQDDYNIVVDETDADLRVNQYYPFKIQIQNYFMSTKANVSIHITIPHLLNDRYHELKVIQSEITELNLGSNDYTFLIPTDEVINSIRIQPKIDILIPGYEIQGLNGVCYQQPDNYNVDASLCPFFQVGSYTGDVYTYTVQNPVQFSMVQQLMYWLHEFIVKLEEVFGIR